MRGTITYHSVERGFAFCRPDGAPGDKSGDIFVHCGALRRSGVIGLQVGQRIEFAKVPSRRTAGAFEADRIKLLPDAQPQTATASQQCPECDGVNRHRHGCALDEAA